MKKDKDEYNNEGKENISEESNQEAKSQNNLLEKYCINLNQKQNLEKLIL